MFGWLKGMLGGSKAQARADPLAAYDGMLEDLEKEAARVRQSAATLAVYRSELSRNVETGRARLEDLERRLDEAMRADEDGLAKTFALDQTQVRERLASDEASLEKTEQDGALLSAAARKLSERISALKAERASAQANLAMGGAASEAMRAEAGHFGHSLALEAAREEVEKAHALAEIYKEEQGG